MKQNNSLQENISANWARRFFTIWIGQAFSLLGSSLVQFALIWWLTRTTGSATVLATSTLVALLPQILLGPIAGALVDRWNRRTVMMVADGVIALFSLLLAGLFFGGLIQVWHVYVVMLIRSAGSAFHLPAMGASTSLLVPRDQLPRIAGLNQTLEGVMNIVAPPFGAVLLSWIPIQGVLMIDVGTAALAVGILAVSVIPQPVHLVDGAPTAKNGVQQVFLDLRAGFKYVISWSGLLILLGMVTMINFLMVPATSLTPLLVINHFGGGALQYGLLDSVFGFGSVAGGLLLSIWGGFHRKIATTLMGIIGLGVGVLLVGVAPANAFWLAVAAMSFAGVMHPLINGPIRAVMQANVAPEMQGRVMSLMSCMATAITPLSLAIAGPIADRISIQTWYLISGVFCILGGIAGYFIPALMNMEKAHQDAQLSQKQLIPEG